MLIEILARTVLQTLWMGFLLSAPILLWLRYERGSSAALRYRVAYSGLALLGLVFVVSFAQLLETTAATPYVAPAALGNIEEAITASAAPGIVSRGDLLPYIGGLYLIGMVLLAVRALGGLYLVERLRRRERLPVPQPWQTRIDELCLRMGLGRVPVYLSRLVPGPLTLGFFKPIILLPVGLLNGLSAEETEVVLAHELSHIRRNDYLWNLIQTALETLLYFHPATWLFGWHLRTEREHATDDLALQVLNGNALIYAKTLLSVHGTAPTPALGFADERSRPLLRRVQRILQPNHQKQPIMNRILSFVLPLLLIGVLSSFILKRNTTEASFERVCTEMAPDDQLLITAEPGAFGLLVDRKTRQPQRFTVAGTPVPRAEWDRYRSERKEMLRMGLQPAFTQSLGTIYSKDVTVWDTIPLGNVQVQNRNGEVEVKASKGNLRLTYTEGVEGSEKFYKKGRLVPPTDRSKYAAQIEAMRAMASKPPPPPPPAPRFDGAVPTPPPAPGASGNIPPPPPPPPAPRFDSGSKPPPPPPPPAPEGNTSQIITTVNGEQIMIVLQSEDDLSVSVVNEEVRINGQLLRDDDPRIVYYGPVDEAPDRLRYSGTAETFAQIESRMEEMRLWAEKLDRAGDHAAADRYRDRMEAMQERLEEKQLQMEERRVEMTERQTERMAEQQERLEERTERMERERLRSMEQMEDEMEERRAEADRRMEEARQEMEEARREIERHSEEIRREVEQVHEMERGHRFLPQNFGNILHNDGLISDPNDYKVSLRNGVVKVNGKKLDAEQSRRYIEVYEDITGNSLDEDYHIQLNHRKD